MQRNLLIFTPTSTPWASLRSVRCANTGLFQPRLALSFRYVRLRSCTLESWWESR
jgi:hypothetical protein